MSSNELLDLIERSGLVEMKTLTKLRREIQLKGHKPKAVIKYLVAKGQLTDAEGEALLAGQIPRRGENKGGYDVRQPAAEEFDTDDLIGMRVASPVANPMAAQPAKRNAGQTSSKGQTRQYDPHELPRTAPSLPTNLEGRVATVVPSELDAPYQGQPQPGFGLPETDPWGMEGTAADRREKLTFRGKIDKSNQWKTRWLYVGNGALMLLLIALGVLAWYMSHISADQLLGEAETDYAQNNFSSAGPKFEQFVERFPRNEKANYARVRAFHCRLVLPFGMRNYGEVLTLANEWLPRLQDYPEFNEIQEDLARILIQTTLRLTQFAMAQKDIEGVKRELARARDAYKLVENPVYVTSVSKRMQYNAVALEQIENNLRTIEGLIRKEEVFRETLTEIERLAAQGQTAEAFGRYIRLTRNYGDLGARKELREAMARVSETESRLVRAVEHAFPVSTTEPAPPYVAKHLFVAHLGAAANTPGELVPFLSQGNVYVADGSNGRILWHRHVGWQTRIAPFWLNPQERRDLIVCDERTYDVMRLDGRTGEIIWRTTIGHPFARPSATSTAIYIATHQGMVAVLDPDTGETRRAVQIPKRLTVSVEAQDHLPIVFVTGYDSNIYVLDAETLECRSVYFTGHSPGAAAIAPTYWAGHLIVALNGSDFSELTALRVEDEGRLLQRIQMIRLASGLVTLPPLRLGRLMMYVSENGQIKLIEMTPAEPETPLRILAEQKFEGFGGQQINVAAEASDLWIAARGLMHFRILRSQGQISREKVVAPLDTFLEILGKYDNRLLSLRQRAGSQQVRLGAGDLNSLSDIWTADFGGALAGSPIVAGDQLVAVTSQGNVFAIDAAEVKQGSPRRLLQSSEIDVPLRYLHNTVMPDGRVICTGEIGGGELLSIAPSLSSLQQLRLASPANSLACPPVALGEDLIVASLKGQVVRVNPTNGRIVGAPFQPPLAPDQTIRWNAPAVVGIDRLLLGDGASGLYLIRAEGTSALRKIGEIQVNGTIIGPIAAAGNVGCAVMRVGQEDSLLLVDCATELSELKTVRLPSLVVGGPWAVGSWFVMAGDDGTVYAYDWSGELRWNVADGNSRLSSVASAERDHTLLAWENGRIVAVDEGGQVVNSIELNQPIRHGVVSFGDYYVVGTLDGGVLFIDKDRL